MTGTWFSVFQSGAWNNSPNRIIRLLLLSHPEVCLMSGVRTGYAGNPIDPINQTTQGSSA